MCVGTDRVCRHCVMGMCVGTDWTRLTGIDSACGVCVLRVCIGSVFVP